MTYLIESVKRNDSELVILGLGQEYLDLENIKNFIEFFA
jgi:hypothetical protein